MTDKFVRPLRTTFQHESCNSTTTMEEYTARLWAFDPGSSSVIWCDQCDRFVDVDECTWMDDGSQVGT